MHIPQAWMVQKSREHFLIVGGQEVEVQHGGCLRLQPTATPIHGPRIAPHSPQLPSESPRACEDLDHEGAVGDGQVVAVAAQRPLNWVLSDRQVLTWVLDNPVGHRLDLIMLVASFCSNRIMQNGPTAARARASNRSRRR